MAGAFLVVNPFVEMPFDDDWSYAFTVRQFLAGGHITYNGWSAPLIITQTLWGALWCKLLGYSVVTLRLSTLPMDIGAAVLCYVLARRADLRPAAALCATLTLCLSPLFLPLALSFMTDVPAVFYVLMSLYLLLRAAHAASTRAAILWLTAGTLAGIIGGMTRQIVWVAPLGVIPYLLILRRGNYEFLFAGILAWMIVLLDIVLCMRWFARQADVFLDPSLITCIRQGMARPRITIINIILVTFTAVMFTLPAALPFALDQLRRLWRERNSWRSALAAIIILFLSAEIARRPAFGMAPWLYNIVTAQGVIGPLEISGDRPFIMPLLIRGVVSALVLMTTYLLAARGAVLLIDFRKSAARTRNFFAAADARAFLVIFGVSYFVLLLIRAGQDLVFDRYCLPLIPCLGIPLLRGRSLALAWPMVVMFGIYGLASTQDNLALAAARRAGVERLESHGVPASQIAAGFEYDFDTQLQEAGRINRYGITNPMQPFNPIQGYTPALRCKYRLEFPLLPNTKATEFGTVDFISWLPPFHRRIYISEFTHPWWFGSSLPPGESVPMNFERDYEPVGAMEEGK